MAIELLTTLKALDVTCGRPRVDRKVAVVLVLYQPLLSVFGLMQKGA